MSVKDEAFRDSIGTISKTGKRNWIFAKKPKGKLYNARTVVSIVYLAVFLILPWLKVQGEPLFLFNVIERKFILFGTVFWPQDFFLFVIAMLTFMVFIVLFTVVFGRIFCGWVCPQTIFMEMVFRKIEYWIDGDAEKQKYLDSAPWNAQKIMKRTGKFLAFFTISFVIAHYFLAYLIGMDNVVLYIKEGLFSHLATFIPLLVFSFVFFGVYWRFREQVCLIVCPYGRLQGVMLDPNSIVVAYDYVRGEPRGKIKKDDPEKLGDCIDCAACVRVCPTGIDIRNGTQLECVNCTACIDACDDIMTKVDRRKGLIRYASENNIAKNEKVKFNARIAAYSVVLVLLVSVFSALLLTRKDVQATVMRAQGMLYQENPGNRISNLYNIQLVNKTRSDIPITLRVEDTGMHAEIKMIGKDMLVKKESASDGLFFVFIDRDKIVHRKSKIAIGIYEGDKKIEEINTNFMGPGGK